MSIKAPFPKAWAGLIIGLHLTAPPAHAEPLTPASLNAGYGRLMGQEARPIDPSTRDADNNRVIVNGLMGDPSGLGAGLAPGLGDAVAPFAQMGRIEASAIANQINIVAAGSWNTIIVDATQTNSGAVQASATLNDGTVTHVSR
jgi:holdfast attachment protein HfaA